MTRKYYWRILHSRLRDRQAVRAKKDYFAGAGIPRKRMQVIPHDGKFCLAWKIYPAELYRKRRDGMYVYGDVEEYRKWLEKRTARVEAWRKRGKK